MRVFLGLTLDAGVRDALASAAYSLDLPGARLVPPENYHLTLRYVGHVDDGQLAAMRRLARETAAAFPPCRAALKGLSFFRAPECAIVYAALAGGDALAPLSERLKAELLSAGLPHDAAPFAAHITLARKARVTPGLLRAPLPPLPVPASAVTLFESARVDGALRYPILEQFPLRG